MSKRKMSSEQVAELRELYATNLHSQTELAKRYGISQCYCSKLLANTYQPDPEYKHRKVRRSRHNKGVSDVTV